jgi:hypothetical protein
LAGFLANKEGRGFLVETIRENNGFNYLLGLLEIGKKIMKEKKKKKKKKKLANDGMVFSV